MISDLERYIEAVHRDWRSIGLAVAIVRGTEVLYSGGFGVRQFDRPERVDADTLFQVGSTTKALAAAALGLLVDEERIGWDDPLCEWMPDLALPDPWRTQHATIRDAVSHRTGVSHSVFPFVAIMNSDDALRELQYVEPEGAFRQSIVYSNLLYGLTAKVVEAAAGCSWHAFLKNRLLSTLGMYRSTTSIWDVWDYGRAAPTYLGTAPVGYTAFDCARDMNIAMPHATEDTDAPCVLPWQSYDNVAPAGALISSARDTANWLILNLNQGCFQGRRLLQRETLQAMHATQNPNSITLSPPFEGPGATYTMGWWRAQYRAHTCLAHSGGIIGFPTYIALLPEQRLGVAVFANGARASEMLIHKAILFGVLDRLLGIELTDWSTEFLRRESVARRNAEQAGADLDRSRLADAAPSLPLCKYTGRYVLERAPSLFVDVSLQADQLTLGFPGQGAYAAVLEPWHRDLFRMRSRFTAESALGPQFAAFALAPSGDVGAVSIFGSTFVRHIARGR